MSYEATCPGCGATFRSSWRECCASCEAKGYVPVRELPPLPPEPELPTFEALPDATPYAIKTFGAFSGASPRAQKWRRNFQYAYFSEDSIGFRPVLK